MGEAVRELGRVQRIASDERLQERQVAEVGEECAVPREQELLRVVTAEPAGAHLPFEEVEKPIVSRGQRNL